MLKNGSFSEGWTDMPPAPGFLINQQPNSWTLRWIEPGGSLFGAGDTASGVPECVHKLSDQLPQDERLGGSKALILAGNATYKIFNAGAAFGAELIQIVTGLQPGSSATLTAPVQLHKHGETDPFGAESGAWVNGEGHWVNGGEVGDRQWHNHKIDFTVPADGRAEIAIRVKSKWPRPKDFFVDGIKLEAIAGTPSDTPTDPPGTGEDVFPPVADNTIRLSVPQGMRVETAAGDEPGVVVVTVPPGFNVEMV